MCYNHDLVASILGKNILVYFKSSTPSLVLTDLKIFKNMTSYKPLPHLEAEYNDLYIYFDFTCGVKNPKYILLHIHNTEVYKIAIHVKKYSIKQYRATSL